MSDREPRPSFIPDEWYENDIGPDPVRMRRRMSDADREAEAAKVQALKAKVRERAGAASERG